MFFRCENQHRQQCNALLHRRSRRPLLSAGASEHEHSQYVLKALRFTEHILRLDRVHLARRTGLLFSHN